MPSDKRALAHLATVEHARALAEKRLPKPVADYLSGGAGAEVTMRGNISSLQREVFVPRMGLTIGAERRDTARDILGHTMPLPLIVGPVGFTRSMHPGGDVAGARAASSLGLTFCQSSMSGHTIEDVAAATSAPYWFQLYPLGGRQGGEQLLARAAAAGATTLVVTLDTAVPGNRERDLTYGAALPVRVNRHTMSAMARYVLPRPGWVARAARDRFRFPLAMTQGMTRDGKEMSEGEALLWWVVEPPTWQDMAWIRAQWPGKLVIKGILSGDDAQRAVDAGADGLVVSNHGGRQLDQVHDSLTALREVVARVGSSTEVMVDGGVRRGSDAIVYLCAGARAVWLGRAWAWGLAAAGEAGVAKVLQTIQTDMIRTMQLLGVTSVDELGEHLLAPRT